MRCPNNILNLIVKEDFQELNNNINAIKNGIQFVRSSTPRHGSFEQRVKSEITQR